MKFNAEITQLTFKLLNCSRYLADRLENEHIMAPCVPAFALFLCAHSASIYRQDSDVCLMEEGFTAVIFHEPSGFASVALVPPLGSVKGETSPVIVLIHHAATGPLGHEASAMSLRFCAAAHQVWVQQLTLPLGSLLYFFFCWMLFAGVRNLHTALTIHTDSGKTLWAVFKNTQRPHPCSDNPPAPWIDLLVQSQEQHVLVRGTLCWCNLFFFFFLIILPLLFWSTRQKEIQRPKRILFFSPSNAELLHGTRHCVRAPRLWRNWGVESASPQWDECVWVWVKSLADGSVELSSSRLSVGRRTGTGLLQQGTD